jgi:ATP-dependent protease ClpP protease subunit
MSAEVAVEYGLVDTVLQHRNELPALPKSES